MSKLNSTVNISEHRFQKMLINNDISKIVFIINHNLVEVSIKKESILKYRNELNQQKILDVIRGPHYSFKVPSPRVFNDNFMNIESKIDIKNRIGYISEDRSDFNGFIFSWGIFLFFLFGF
jgi:cell division protease FtsH